MEGSDHDHKSKVEPEKKDFWDSFGEPSPSSSSSAGAAQRSPANVAPKKSGAIGTAAMKKGGAGSGGDTKDEWDNDKW